MARRFSWRSDARATWPRFASVIVLEVALGVVIIGMASAAIIPPGMRSIARAMMTEAFTWTGPAKAAIIEQYALTGQPLPSDLAGHARAAESSAVPEYEQHLSTARAFAAVGGATSPQDDSRGRHDGSPNQVRYGVRDGAVVVLGRLGRFERPYRLTVSAAVRPGGEAVVIHWVCGNAPAPAGFEAIGQRMPSRVSPDLLPSHCRGTPSP